MTPTPEPDPQDPAHRLGARWTGHAVRFSLFSEHASAVELCLFADPAAARESRSMALDQGPHGFWHLEVPGVGPGHAYGYRVHGRDAPERGFRFNPAKLLLDPYALAVTGRYRWNDAVRGHATDPTGRLVPDDRDSAPFVPRGIVVDTSFAWGQDRGPGTPANETLLYECHVKGMSKTHPDVPDALRGTYLGLCSEPVIDHLQRLGVTAVQLLPVHHAVTERAVQERGLENYWGYNTLGYFAPDARFATGGLGEQVVEFKTMVKTLHANGIEVLLDVVYNHTAEGDASGPTLSWRGIDNTTYYILGEDRAEYRDFAGTGNTLGMHHPQARRLVMDSLRYWVREMHVDGFRFDLAPALARGAPDGFTAFFESIRDDPVLAGVKLIAEPWDTGDRGYRLGRFPRGWAEWNDQYRDTVRRFWRGDAGQRAAQGTRLAGSSDLFAPGGRTPQAGINYVACHDGLTLHDLVSYERRHNDANGEENRDGTAANWSSNWGVEGPSDDEVVAELRERMKRNMIATLACSLGVPMLGHGDEMGRTQRGNNNAYCQDNPTTWIDWHAGPAARALCDFTARVFALRSANPVFRRTAFLNGERGPDRGPDVTWFGPDSCELTEAEWHDPDARMLAMLLRADARSDEEVPSGARPAMVILNAGETLVHFPLHLLDDPGVWVLLVDTAEAHGDERVVAGSVAVDGRSMMVLEYRDPA